MPRPSKKAAPSSAEETAPEGAIVGTENETAATTATGDGAEIEEGADEAPAEEDAPPMPSEYALKPVRLHLRSNFTDAEKVEFAQQLAEAQREIESIEAEKKRANTQFKSRIESASADREEMMDRIQTGYEMRETLCTVTANVPEVGKKTIVRTDTGEVVRVETMTDAERQLELPGVGEAADAEQSHAPQSSDDDEPQSVAEEKPLIPHRASRRGVVAVPSDGDDIDDPEDNDAGY